MLDKRVDYFLRELGNIPNAPYLPQSIVSRICELLEQIKSFNPQQLDVTKNHLGVFAEISSPAKSKLPILVSAHIDHPLFITKAKGKAVPFGLISTKQIDVSLGKEDWEIPIFLWSKEGKQLGKAVLTKRSKQRNAVVEADFHVPKNCHVMWDLPLKINDEFVSLIAADNLLNCAICLAAIERILEKQEIHCDIIFMFGAIEEIKQLSVTGVIQEGLPNGKRIGRNWLIFVLEVGPTLLRPHLERARNNYDLPEPNEYGGPALRISDDYMLHGQQVQGFNLAEHVLLESCKHTSTPYQHSVSGGMCDASVFTSLGASANIAGIALVNNFRHNIAKNEFPVYEQVRVKDINHAMTWLIDSLLNASKYTKSQLELGSLLTTKLKGTELEASPTKITKINIDRLSTYLAMRPRMVKGYYFPETLIDRVRFWYAIGKAMLFRLNQYRKTIRRNR